MQSVVAKIHLNLSAKITGNTNSVQVRGNVENAHLWGVRGNYDCKTLVKARKIFFFLVWLI